MKHCAKSIARIRSYSGPFFPVFGLNIQSECGKIRETTEEKNIRFLHYK